MRRQFLDLPQLVDAFLVHVEYPGREGVLQELVGVDDQEGVSHVGEYLLLLEADLDLAQEFCLVEDGQVLEVLLGFGDLV